MFYSFYCLGRTVGIGAAGYDFICLFLDGYSTLGALLWEGDRLLFAGTELGENFDDIGYDIASPFNSHMIANHCTAGYVVQTKSSSTKVRYLFL